MSILKFKKNTLFIVSLSTISIVSIVATYFLHKGNDSNQSIIKFTPVGGFYKKPQSIKISSKLKGGKIYYTTDGSTPDINSTEYTKPFNVDRATIIRAMAVTENKKHHSMTAYDFDFSEGIKSHMKSPEWEDQIIYFLMIDRFADGDRTNNRQGVPEVENSPEKESNYSGGDFQGLIDKLQEGYFTDLGITAIWITPPVKNQYYQGTYGGFHGYWASDFTKVDPHSGNMAKYREFVQLAHKKGIYVIQDIVVNHVGDFFDINNNRPYVFNSRNWSHKKISKPMTEPEQIPWSFNDPSVLTEEELKNNSFYHWYPSINNFNDTTQLHKYQLSNLDDLNTDNPVVQNLLRGYYRYWIDKVDIDGYRIDTVKYVDKEFFEDFVNSKEDDHLGIREYAKSLGKNDFILFGEAWTNSDKLVASYTGGRDGKKRLDSMIYFPLANGIRNVFASGTRTSELSEILERRYTSGYANPHRLVTFVDNHDMARLRSLTSENLTKSAYAFIMTIPGIPQIYYGSEQSFRVSRRAMFKGGYQGENLKVNSHNHYDRSTPMYKFLKELIALRRGNSLFRKGKLTVIKDNKNSNGIFAYSLIEEKEISKKAFVIFNTSDHKLATGEVKTDFSNGSIFTLQRPSTGLSEKKVTIKREGSLSMVIPAQSYGIYLKTEEDKLLEKRQSRPVLTGEFPHHITGDTLTLKGSVDKLPAKLSIYFNGRIDSGETFYLDNQQSKKWEKRISLSGLSNGTHELSVALHHNGDYIFSDPVELTIERPFKLRGRLIDPLGDDRGPAGKEYKIPRHKSFKPHQQDIKSVEVYTSGPDIKLKIEMKSTTKIWNPDVNDFDHVMFGIFIKKKNSISRVKSFPGHNYNIPISWDYYIRMDGWSSSIFGYKNGSATNNGTALTPAPDSMVNHDKRIIIFNIRGDSIGNPTNLEGWQIYIATWDSDSGNPRGLSKNGGDWRFSGGRGDRGDPLIIDETAVLKIGISLK